MSRLAPRGWRPVPISYLPLALRGDSCCYLKL